MLALLKTLRPKQWVKNLFVAVPLFYALRLSDGPSVLRTAAAVALFSLISGCVYVLNDLVDIEADRKHPTKRLRPIPSGELPAPTAKTFLAVAVPTCVGLALWLDLGYATALSSYFVLNIAYSLWLKTIAYVDVLAIATMFILRVTAGALVIDVEPSPWLLACTFLLALFLGFGKRAHELAVAQDAAAQRAALASYNLASLRWIMHGLAVVVVVVYVLYTRSPKTIETFQTAALVYTVPFPVVGILRFVWLATSRDNPESPTDAMLKDGLFMAILLGWVLMTGAVLYWR
ncbi:MAG: UbiA prenyltransferase family protein [Nannocystaceae bacterium]|nr:UbiA prenyltransferase family protein [Nannocystaceae bacterium]